MNFVVQSRAKRASSIQDAAKGVDFVVTMLPVGANVREVYLACTVLIDLRVPATPMTPTASSCRTGCFTGEAQIEALMRKASDRLRRQLDEVRRNTEKVHDQPQELKEAS